MNLSHSCAACGITAKGILNAIIHALVIHAAVDAVGNAIVHRKPCSCEHSVSFDVQMSTLGNYEA